MPRYRYQTRDALGRPISGELEAGRIEEALEELGARGLHPERDELEEIADDLMPTRVGRRLSTGEAVEFAGNLSELTRAQLPLAPGLRAMADELQGGWGTRISDYMAWGIVGVVAEDRRGRRLSGLFRGLSRQADEGVPLETALAKMGDRFPGHIRGLILAGTRSGRLAEVLGEFSSLERERSDLSWRIRMSMAYPLLMVAALLLMFMFSGLFIVPPMANVLEDFGADMPPITVFFIATSINGTRILVVFFVILGPLLLLWLVLPRPRWAVRWLYSVPYLGSIWKWQALVEFSRLMGLLLAQDVPLPEALRLTSEGMRSPDLRAACLESAVEVEAGNSFSDCVQRQKAFPPTLKPFVDFGSQSSRPSEGFEAAAEAFHRRINVDAGLWEVVIPPIMLVLIAVFVGLMAISLFMPLISLIQNLS